MKKICYHGTKADNLDSILKNGLTPQRETLWTVSGNSVYAWSIPEIASADYEDEEWAFNESKRRAMDSACFALAKSKDCRRIIIEIDYDGWDCLQDESCENMSGAICTDTFPAERIKRIWRDKESLEPLRGLFLAMHKGRTLSVPLELSPFEKMLSEVFERSGWDGLHEYLDSEDSLELIYENGVVLETRKIL